MAGINLSSCHYGFASLVLIWGLSPSKSGQHYWVCIQLKDKIVLTLFPKSHTFLLLYFLPKQPVCFSPNNPTVLAALTNSPEQAEKKENSVPVTPSPAWAGSGNFSPKTKWEAQAAVTHVITFFLFYCRRSAKKSFQNQGRFVPTSFLILNSCNNVPGGEQRTGWALAWCELRQSKYETHKNRARYEKGFSLTTSFTTLNYFRALNIQLIVNRILTLFASPCTGIQIVPELGSSVQFLERKPGSSYS